MSSSTQNKSALGPKIILHCCLVIPLSESMMHKDMPMLPKGNPPRTAYVSYESFKKQNGTIWDSNSQEILITGYEENSKFPYM